MLRLLREGKTTREISDTLEIPFFVARGLVGNLRQQYGIALVSSKPRRIRAENDKSGGVLKAQLHDCIRELGRTTVELVLGDEDIEGPELQRLHAALRVVVLDAEPLVRLVKARLAVRRGEALGRLAQGRRDA